MSLQMFPGGSVRKYRILKLKYSKKQQIRLGEGPAVLGGKPLGKPAY